MPNELILVISLIFYYSGVLIFYKFFGLNGLYCYSVIATIFANIEVAVLITAFGLSQTLGNIMFACTFLITDIVSEIYGKKEAKRVVNISIITSILFIITTQIWMSYTPSEGDFAMSGLKILFSNTPRIVISSLVVYAIVQKLDVFLYHKWWEFTEKKFGDKKKYLYIRNNLSTLISQLINTILFTSFAFLGIFDLKTVLIVMASTYIIYLATSLLDTPIVYLVRKIKPNENFKCVDEIDY